MSRRYRRRPPLRDTASGCGGGGGGGVGSHDRGSSSPISRPGMALAAPKSVKAARRRVLNFMVKMFGMICQEVLWLR